MVFRADILLIYHVQYINRVIFESLLGVWYFSKNYPVKMISIDVQSYEGLSLFLF